MNNNDDDDDEESTYVSSGWLCDRLHPSALQELLSHSHSLSCLFLPNSSTPLPQFQSALPPTSFIPQLRKRRRRKNPIIPLPRPGGTRGGSRRPQYPASIPEHSVSSQPLSHIPTLPETAATLPLLGPPFGVRREKKVWPGGGHPEISFLGFCGSIYIYIYYAECRAA